MKPSTSATRASSIVTVRRSKRDLPTSSQYDDLYFTSYSPKSSIRRTGAERTLTSHHSIVGGWRGKTMGHNWARRAAAFAQSIQSQPAAPQELPPVSVQAPHRAANVHHTAVRKPVRRASTTSPKPPSSVASQPVAELGGTGALNVPASIDQSRPISAGQMRHSTAIWSALRNDLLPRADLPAGRHRRTK